MYFIEWGLFVECCSEILESIFEDLLFQYSMIKCIVLCDQFTVTSLLLLLMQKLYFMRLVAYLLTTSMETEIYLSQLQFNDIWVHVQNERRIITAFNM
jgi:hypothetical protein